MLPQSLTAAQVQQYPPEARELAVSHLELLRQMPLGFLPSLLQEVIEYDHRFPAERDSLNRELTYLGSLSQKRLETLFVGFSRIQVSAEQQRLDWVNQPLAFTEQFSAHLWSTHQMDAFQAAAASYGNQILSAVPPPKPAIPRLAVAVIGGGVDSYTTPLFERLRPHGTYFRNVQPQGGLQALIAATKRRASAQPAPYAHWYVDGGDLADSSAELTCMSYGGLSAARNALLTEIQQEVSKAGTGPESLRNHIAHLQPDRLGLNGDRVLDRFQMKILTEGSGTQIFSTTFVQWTTREVLRRASPLTVLARFAPRQRQRPMSELLSNSQRVPEVDPAGSLIDADMAAYYQWINLQRLAGHEEAVFLVWFEGHKQALAIAPTLPRGVESKTALDLTGLLALATQHEFPHG